MLVLAAFAAQTEVWPCDTALVLSGGGERGAAHIGVIKALDEFIYAGSVFLVYDSPVGPIVFALGWAEDGGGAGYLLIGLARDRHQCRSCLIASVPVSAARPG